MNTLARAQRVVGAAYVRREGDAIAVALFEELEREIAVMRAQLEAGREAARSMSGRQVFVRAMVWMAVIAMGVGVGFYLMRNP